MLCLNMRRDSWVAKLGGKKSSKKDLGKMGKNFLVKSLSTVGQVSV